FISTAYSKENKDHCKDMLTTHCNDACSELKSDESYETTKCAKDHVLMATEAGDVTSKGKEATSL
ncbi:hypothetical protein PFISCL1PPCAC_5092, partial [Pristionchus fissidentatus]